MANEPSIYDRIGDLLRQSATPMKAAEVGRKIGITAGVARSRLLAMESGGLVAHSRSGWHSRTDGK